MEKYCKIRERRDKSWEIAAKRLPESWMVNISQESKTVMIYSAFRDLKIKKLTRLWKSNRMKWNEVIPSICDESNFHLGDWNKSFSELYSGDFEWQISVDRFKNSLEWEFRRSSATYFDITSCERPAKHCDDRPRCSQTSHIPFWPGNNPSQVNSFIAHRRQRGTPRSLLLSRWDDLAEVGK
jgi:hypothetical protein